MKVGTNTACNGTHISPRATYTGSCDVIAFCLAVFIQKVSQFNRKAHLNISPHSSGIFHFLSLQKMNCTLQIMLSHSCLPSQHEACYCCSRSGGESCPVRAKTRRSDCRSPVCNHPTRGRNPQNRQISSETLSIPHLLFCDHRRL